MKTQGVRTHGCHRGNSRTIAGKRPGLVHRERVGAGSDGCHVGGVRPAPRQDRRAQPQEPRRRFSIQMSPPREATKESNVLHSTCVSEDFRSSSACGAGRPSRPQGCATERTAGGPPERRRARENAAQGGGAAPAEPTRPEAQRRSKEAKVVASSSRSIFSPDNKPTGRKHLRDMAERADVTGASAPEHKSRKRRAGGRRAGAKAGA